MAEAYIPRGDPGPLPESRHALGGPGPEEHEPYLDFLAWVLDGPPSNKGDGSRFFPRAMTAEQRIDWIRSQLPRTYSLLVAGQHWPALSDL